MFTIVRNNTIAQVGLSEITESDLVLCADGRFYLVQSVSSLRSFLLYSRQVQQRVAANEPNGWWSVLLFLGLGLLVFRDFHDPTPKACFRFRVRNDEPLSASQRAHVRERDESVCTYCRRYAPDGHVDHRVSRANGGTNHMNNLSWACASCNCSKGARNARQFMRLV